MIHDKKDVERSLEMALRLKDKDFRFHLETAEILMGIPSWFIRIQIMNI